MTGRSGVSARTRLSGASGRVGRVGAGAALTFVLLATTAPPTRAQATIKVSDDVNLRFGILGQFQADTIEDPGTDAQTNNLFIRRVRLLFGGQVAKNVTFFVETDSANLGLFFY